MFSRQKILIRDLDTKKFYAYKVKVQKKYDFEYIQIIGSILINLIKVVNLYKCIFLKLNSFYFGIFIRC